jgi:hypothetical protein
MFVQLPHPDLRRNRLRRAGPLSDLSAGAP